MLRNRRSFTARRRRRAPDVITIAPLRRVTLERVLALPAVDHMLARLLSYPRALQSTGIVVGLLMALLALYPLVFPSSRLAAPATAAVAAPAAAKPQERPGIPTDQEVLAVVAAYNQASIAAAVLNKADAMAPYLAPDGQAWAEVRAEYQRRATKGETHDPALTRWGILQIAVNRDTATVETQEQWDDIASVGGEVISSKRGILTRNSYDLRRSPSLGRWLITSVTSALVIG